MELTPSAEPPFSDLDLEASVPLGPGRTGGLWSSEEGSGRLCVFKKLRLVGEPSWSSSQSSTYWESGEVTRGVAEWGRRPTLSDNPFGRARFLSMGIRRFASPPNLSHQTRDSGLPPNSEEQGKPL